MFLAAAAGLYNPRMTHFLHTADWQIGRQYGQFETDDAALLAELELRLQPLLGMVEALERH